MPGIGDRKPITKWKPEDNMYTYIADRLYERLLGEEKYESGWLIGWRNVKFPDRGILHYTGIATKDTARKYELEYGMPVHRLPDARPRAIRWQLDLWLIQFAKLLEEAAYDSKLGTKRSRAMRRRLDYCAQDNSKRGAGAKSTRPRPRRKAAT